MPIGRDSAPTASAAALNEASSLDQVGADCPGRMKPGLTPRAAASCSSPKPGRRIAQATSPDFAIHEGRAVSPGANAAPTKFRIEPTSSPSSSRVITARWATLQGRSSPAPGCRDPPTRARARRRSRMPDAASSGGQIAATAGGLSDHGDSASICAASESNVLSWLGLPTIWTARGRPCDENPAGTEAAG
jgi:hypothetical protein